MGNFDGQVAWVTGGGSGIGAACAQALAPGPRMSAEQR